MNAILKDDYLRGSVILFVGAGVSATLGLPNWNQLIARIAFELDFDPDVFASYGSHFALAEYFKLRKGGFGSLRSWMDREWHNPAIDVKKSNIHGLIAKGNFARIYTTNYDRWLEKAHEALGVPYAKVAKVADLVGLKETKRQIIKLHGDFDDDDSIVLGETSYFDRLMFESPLDIKLRHDALGSSMLFIGYSINDPNIRLLFHRLTQMWSTQTLASARPRSYLLASRPNPVAEAVLGQWGIEMIVSEEENSASAVEIFLKALIE